MYLVTGGCGFIGSHLCEALLKAGHKVRVLDNLSSGVRENLGPRVELIVGDIRDKDVLRRAADGTNGCFHLAAIASVQVSQERPKEAHDVNLGGAVNVFEAAHAKSIPVVYASSAAVYGDNPDLPLTETSKTQPLTLYGADKLACEEQARMDGLASVGLRFFNVYGRRQNPDSPYSGVISIFLKRFQQNQPVTIYGDGEQSRDFVHVNDAVECLAAAMHRMTPHTRSVFNVCTERSTTVNQLTDALAKATGRKVGRNYQPARTGDIRFSLGNPAAVKKALGVALATTLDEGLKELVSGTGR